MVVAGELQFSQNRDDADAAVFHRCIDRVLDMSKVCSSVDMLHEGSHDFDGCVRHQVVRTFKGVLPFTGTVSMQNLCDVLCQISDSLRFSIRVVKC